MSKSKTANFLGERTRQALWAGLIALVCWLLGLLGPIDQLTWVLQSRIANFQASGDIVFVGSKNNLADTDFPGRRIKLAQALDTLKAAGVSQVYVDVEFDLPSTPNIDGRLNASLREFDGSAFLVRNLKTTAITEEIGLSRSTPSVQAGVSEVATDRYFEFLGIVWDQPYSVSHLGETISGLSASMAGIYSSSDARFPVNYSFNPSTIPSYDLNDLIRSGAANTIDLSGKTVLIANNSSADTVTIPGQIEVPISMADIYAAETLKSGYTRSIGAIVVLSLAMLSLFLAVFLKSKTLRRITYAIGTLAIPAAVLLSSNLGMRISVSTAIAVLLIYILFRLRTKWKTSFRMVDLSTGLPTFSALENDKEVQTTSPAIIVAKIHRFDEVRKTLRAEHHAEYVLKIVERLNAATPNAKIYSGSGSMLAWVITEKDPALVKEHLEGLRALFAAPLVVGGNQVDVSLTFGVEITPSSDVGRRLASAVSAADRTNETYEPIQIAEVKSDEDLIWDISIQARIDNALSNGEIYLAYQPKIHVNSGKLAGVEALVRWNDPVRGMISPDIFIKQCESSGRMAHLTRHVLRHACNDGIRFGKKNITVPIAVNISATLLHERGIVAMVREVLAETGYDPNLLTLEITETYRISNLGLAAEILNDLRALGTKVSMDDFGVGAASLEALMRLPFTELKIDRLFISGILEDPKALGIVHNILRLGKDLRIIVVAEGVEDTATLTLLRDSGCLIAQGFGISRPVPFNEIVSFHALTQNKHTALSI